jgi:hypothetical protein
VRKKEISRRGAEAQREKKTGNFRNLYIRQDLQDLQDKADISLTTQVDRLKAEGGRLIGTNHA